MDVKTPGSPGWALVELQAKLNARQERLAELWARYDTTWVQNEQLLYRMGVNGDITKVNDAFDAFKRICAAGFEEMIVQAVKHRMQITAIRTAVDSGDQGDAEAWKLFRDAGLLTTSGDVHRGMLVAGDSYAIVGLHNGALSITAEDARQVVTIHDPVDQRYVLWAGKFATDMAGIPVAYLFGWQVDADGNRIPCRWIARAPEKGTATVTDRWTISDAAPVPGGRFPVVRFRNEEGVGEFERRIPLLDQIAHVVLQGLVIATLQAFKQRAVMVDPNDMPDEDEDGNEIDYSQVFAASPDAIWKLPATAKMWESGAVDLTPVLTMADKAIQRLSSASFTPLPMFSPEGQNQSAEGASLAKEGLHSKCEDRVRRASESWSEVLAVAFAIAGDATRADRGSIEIDWRPIERYSLQEKYSAAVQAVTAGVPWRTRMMKILQFSPEEVRRMEAEQAQDALNAAMFSDGAAS